MIKKRVLIVDDDSRNIFALGATLRAKGYDCFSCLSAEEAINILSSDERVDVVLMDMMMPDMDGYEAIPIIKKIQLRAAMPVIAVTALAMVGDREKCLAAGADNYISKPINVDKMLQILSTI